MTDYSISALPWLEDISHNVVAQLMANTLSHAHVLAIDTQLGGQVLARHMAKSAMCLSLTAQGPCQVCKACLLISAGNHPDLHELYPDGQYIKVDQVRGLCRALTSTAQQGGKRVAILYQSERMNTASANALLKTLEEPGNDVFLLLQTDLASGLLATIKSRCQFLSITPPSSPAVNDWLSGQDLLPKPIDGKKAGDVTWCLSVVGGPLKLAESLRSGHYQTLVTYRSEWGQSLASGHLCGSLATLKESELIAALQVLYLYLRHFVLKSNDINAFTQAQIISLAATVMDMCHKLTGMAAVNAQGICLNYLLKFRQVIHIKG